MNNGSLVLVTLFCIPCAVVACGAKADIGTTRATTGGAGNDGEVGGTANAGQSSRLCPGEEPTAAPQTADGCAVAAVALDASPMCESTPCPITKALDVDCQSTLAEPRIAANANSARVIVQTKDASASAQLITVTSSESRVQQLPTPLPSDALGLEMEGGFWVFGGATSGITTLHENAANWQSTTLSMDSPRAPVSVTSADMVVSTLGYVTFLLNGIEPHLATWDGACWKQAKLGDGSNEQFVVKAGAHGYPSVAWESIPTDTFVIAAQSVAVHSPRSGLPDESVALPPVSSETLHYGSPQLRLLPDGLDGEAAFPTLAMKLSDGIHLYTYNASVASHWVQQLMPDSAPAAATGNCPEAQSYSQPACLGRTSCSEQVNGSGTHFDVARTQSGMWYVAWLEYASEATYDLQEIYDGGELASSWCVRDETSGAGTTDLVIARLTNGDPVRSRFRLYADDVQATDDGIALATRGDSLLVAAIVNRSNTPVLRYIEIDTTRLQ